MTVPADRFQQLLLLLSGASATSDPLLRCVHVAAARSLLEQLRTDVARTELAVAAMEGELKRLAGKETAP